MENNVLNLKINGRAYQFTIGYDVLPSETLSHLLRDRLGLLGAKISCDSGECGACTVLVDNKAVLSCMTVAATLEGCEVTTIEGLAADDPVILAFAQQCEPGYGTATQCGFCTPGFVMSAKALLLANPEPTEAEIRHALSGNLCRCGTYTAVIQAVKHAAEMMKERKAGK